MSRMILSHTEERLAKISIYYLKNGVTLIRYHHSQVNDGKSNFCFLLSKMLLYLELLRQKANQDDVKPRYIHS
jgi:hypothetical protein